MNFQLIIFSIFSAILLFAAAMVIFSRHPVRGVLFLVLAFFASSILWMLLEAEFLSLVLIFVYVGAVMTLFLFVVMMINIDLAPLSEGFVRYLPLGLLVTGMTVGMIMYALSPKHFPLGVTAVPEIHPGNYSNVKELGSVLYTQYVYPFEIASALLLVAIVSAISLAFRGRRPDSKAQKISEQVAVHKKDRFYVVNMRSDQP
ncbi:MAG: NADH-quinone oxidoreductase subunit J [Gammaproteobacteria bacterium]|nr:NADH-quinone oxidoreductase subunit J [Gammaproteobacteria bacterium]